MIGGAPLDAVDVIKNGALLRRFSCRWIFGQRVPLEMLRTKLMLEVGWGSPRCEADWDVRFGISGGRLLSVEPRFRGPEIVAPQEADRPRDLIHMHRTGSMKERQQCVSSRSRTATRTI